MQPVERKPWWRVGAFSLGLAAVFAAAALPARAPAWALALVGLGLLGAAWRRGLAWFAAFALTLEVGARIYLFGASGLSPAFLASFQPMGVSTHFEATRVPDLVYRLKPGLDGFVYGAPLRTNSRGMVDQEYETSKPPGTIRVAVVGSSFAQAIGVAPEEAFHAAAERELNAAGTSPPVEIWNFAVGAYDPRQALAALRHLALPIHPDVVLFCFPMVGVREERFYREPFEPVRPTWPPLGSFSAMIVSRKVVEPWLFDPARETALAGEQVGLPQVLHEVAALARQQGIRVAVVRVGRMFPYDGDPERVPTITRQAGLPFVDLTTAFGDCGGRSCMSTPRYFLNPADPHPNAAAHAVLGHELARWLRTAGLAPGPGP